MYVELIQDQYSSFFCLSSTSCETLYTFLKNFNINKNIDQKKLFLVDFNGIFLFINM